MSERSLPSRPPSTAAAIPTNGASAPAAWGSSAPAPATGNQWRRYAGALRRNAWLVLLVLVLGTMGGLLATRLITPQYQAQATIWIPGNQPLGQSGGPIQAQEVVSPQAWVELIKSFAIIDRVVDRGRLYLYSSRSDSAQLAGLEAARDVRPGAYTLAVAGNQYELSSGDTLVERGVVGDSIGRPLGLKWAPSAEVLPPGTRIEFTVLRPRAVAAHLRQNLDAQLGERTNILRLTLNGRSPRRTAETLNLWVDEFVVVAGELKKRSLVEVTKVLEDQLQFAQAELRSAEKALERFRVNTITLPSEGGSPMASGLDVARDPVFDSYFRQKVEQDDVRRDREALERVLASGRGEAVPAAIAAMPNVLQSSPALQNALQEYYTKQTELRTAQRFYTDSHPSVVALRQNVELLSRQTIPAAGREVLMQLRQREADLGGRIQSASQELRRVPARTIEEMRLRRNVAAADNLYTNVRNRYETARLAAASEVADVSVLDPASPPGAPTRNTAPMIVLMAFAGSLVVGVGLALARDHVDPRFRYPEQATHELGLEIIGAVPSIAGWRGDQTDPEAAAQIIEAFRSIRLALLHAFDPSAPVLVTVSSPGMGDGKSMISSNLALSFAEAGHRTLLIDGDIRRGQQHAIFGVGRRPGLLDYLVGDATVEAITRETPVHDNLMLIPSGTRRHRGPELLASQAMTRLVAGLKAHYDVILVDSPPLSAGIDAFALSAATGHMMMVLRTGTTDRKMAEAKLEVLDRLPVRLLGAVLNDVKTTGATRYYSYLPGYGVEEDEEPRLIARAGELSGQA